MKFDEVTPDIPPGWETSVEWRVVSTSDDPEGWQYGVDFNSTDWFMTAEAPGGGLLKSTIRHLYYRNRELFTKIRYLFFQDMFDAACGQEISGPSSTKNDAGPGAIVASQAFASTDQCLQHQRRCRHCSKVLISNINK